MECSLLGALTSCSSLPRYFFFHLLTHTFFLFFSFSLHSSRGFLFTRCGRKKQTKFTHCFFFSSSIFLFTNKQSHREDRGDISKLRFRLLDWLRFYTYLLFFGNFELSPSKHSRNGRKVAPLGKSRCIFGALLTSYVEPYRESKFFFAFVWGGRKCASFCYATRRVYKKCKNSP